MICFKHKETGRIYTLVSTTMTSSGSFCELGTDSSELVRVDRTDILTEYEEINNTVDYDAIWPLVKNYMQFYPEINNLFSSFLRRMTKDYFTPGKYVIATDVNDNNRVGNRIFRIKEIRSTAGRGDVTISSEVILVRADGNTISEFSYPIYTSRFRDRDAFSSLKRLDLPF